MLFYEHLDKQHKKTVLLLHSGGMAGVEWQPQLAALSKVFNVLVPDLPGHGRSLVAEGETISIASMGEAVIALLDALSLEQVHVVGSSMGGAVALWLCLNHPSRFSRLVLYRIGYSKNAATYEQTKSMANPEYWRQYGMHQWLSTLHSPQGGASAWERVIARVSEILDPAHSAHDHQLADLARLPKTLLIAGDRDPLIPLDTLLAMYQTIPDAALWVIPNASHITASNTWRAEAFAEELIRFLKAN